MKHLKFIVEATIKEETTGSKVTITSNYTERLPVLYEQLDRKWDEALYKISQQIQKNTIVEKIAARIYQLRQEELDPNAVFHLTFEQASKTTQKDFINLAKWFLQAKKEIDNEG